MFTNDFQVVLDRHEPVSRRVRLLSVKLDVFVRLFIPGPKNVWFQCYDGLPEGVKVIGAQLDALTQTITLALEHESFEEVREGSLGQPIGASFMSLTLAEGETGLVVVDS